MQSRIENLSSEEYHKSPTYATYLSSTQLKRYLTSAKAARCRFRISTDGVFMGSVEEESTDAMRLGSLFHSAMEIYAKGGDIDDWFDTLTVFAPPVNEKTGKPWRATAKAYQEAYAEFLENNAGKTVCTEKERAMVDDMVGSLVTARGGKTAEQVRKLLKWAKESEVSYFYESEDGIKLKVRPDMLTGTKLIDWKTTSGELDEESIARCIIKFGYHISLSFYQFVLREITGKWYKPYLVFVQNKEPYDCIIVDLSAIVDENGIRSLGWCYDYDEDFDVVSKGVGAIEFERLLALHTKCVKENRWPGVEDAVEDEKKIMQPSVPTWYGMKIINQ